MTNVYIVRHAQALGNLLRRFQGSTDLPVSEFGLRQLECLAGRFNGFSADALYTSPLIRAAETARAVNTFLGLDIALEPDFAEINAGEWENRTFEEVDTAYPEQRDIWRRQPHLFEAPGGETMQQVYDRAVVALKRIAHRHDGENVIIVSHGCVTRNLLGWVLGGIEMQNDAPWVRNTSVTHIEVEDGAPTLVTLDDCSHLPPELITP